MILCSWNGASALLGSSFQGGGGGGLLFRHSVLYDGTLYSQPAGVQLKTTMSPALPPLELLGTLAQVFQVLSYATPYPAQWKT